MVTSGRGSRRSKAGGRIRWVEEARCKLTFFCLSLFKALKRKGKLAVRGGYKIKRFINNIIAQ